MEFWRDRGRMITAKGLAWLLAPATALAIMGTGISTSSSQRIENPAEVKAFQGGKFQASGVVAIPGAHDVLMVDNDRPGEVLFMPLNDAGTQDGAITPIPLGVVVADPEGITSDGSHFYVIGSQSKGASDGAGLVRFDYDPETRAARNVETLAGVGTLIRQNVAELRQRPLNIEALAWDPAGNRLLLGFREPVLNGDAVVLPLTLRDRHGAWSWKNIQFGPPIYVPLGGGGFRDLQYSDGKFLAIAEPASGSKKDRFRLLEWAGASHAKDLRQIADLDGRLKPEGIAAVTIGGRAMTLVVCDASYYLTLATGKPRTN